MCDGTRRYMSLVAYMYTPLYNYVDEKKKKKKKIVPKDTRLGDGTSSEVKQKLG